MSEKPTFKDLTLYDQETGEPFTFTAKEQEFFWRQGFTNVPKYTPERRKMMREKRFEGKEVFNVTCKRCGKVGKVLQKPPYPREVYCDNCFQEIWPDHLEKHPDVRAIHEQAEAEAEADRQARAAERERLAAEEAARAAEEQANYSPY
jgi:CxxC-x17-CxxC domain-containing protein